METIDLRNSLAVVVCVGPFEKRGYLKLCFHTIWSTSTNLRPSRDPPYPARPRLPIRQW